LLLRTIRFLITATHWRKVTTINVFVSINVSAIFPTKFILHWMHRKQTVVQQLQNILTCVISWTEEQLSPTQYHYYSTASITLLLLQSKAYKQGHPLAICWCTCNFLIMQQTVRVATQYAPASLLPMGTQVPRAPPSRRSRQADTT